MKIKKLRMSKKMTQAEFANFIGVKRTTLSMWENGNSYPSISMLKEIAKILDCKIEDLI